MEADVTDRATEDEQPAETLRLALIEDDPQYAWLVEEMLREAFAGAITVESFGTLGDALGSGMDADCALVDLSLPDARGFEVIERVQEVFAALPVVVLTGAEDEGLALQAVERGAQDYLVKRRVDPDVLGRSIRYAIERSRSERQRAELLQARAAHAEAEAISGTLERLQAVADTAITLQGGELDRDELLERSLAVIAADAGALIVEDSGSGRPVIAAARGIPGLTRRTTLEGDLIDSLIEADAAVVVSDLSAGGTDPFHSRGVCSLVAVPLQADGQRIGALVATSRMKDRFSSEQARLLALAGERCGRALANAASYERERRTAAALQTGLLPQAVPELRQGEIAVRYLPARDGPAIGGDWYDAIVLPDGGLGIAIGDVTGHGARAAVLMGQLRTALRAYAIEGSSPEVVASRLNTLTLSLGEMAMATFVYVVLDPGLTSGRYVNAGHPPPIVVSERGAELLPGASSPPAGAAPTSEFAEHELKLAAGDALCLYSDGLVEQRGADFAQRESALLSAIGHPADAEVLCERALAALRPDGPAEDDVALLVLRTSSSGAGLTTTHPATAESLGPARGELQAWLTDVKASRAEAGDIVMASNEACMNVVEHAYEDDPGSFTLEGYLDRQTVVIIVRDAGHWSEVRARGRGRGLKLMEALMSSVQLSFSAEGTMVVLRKELEAPAPA
jgi:serine phosphatase RsbU (regulator of sigma subunit)/DNA-binding response OmpR family regulator